MWHLVTYGEDVLANMLLMLNAENVKIRLFEQNETLFRPFLLKKSDFRPKSVESDQRGLLMINSV